MRGSAVLLVGCLALLATGCASVLPGARTTPTARPVTEDAGDEVTKARLDQLQRQAAMAEAEIKLLRRQMAALEIELESLSAAASPAAAAPSPRRVEPIVEPPPARPSGAFETRDLQPTRVDPPMASAPAPEVVNVAPPGPAPASPPAATATAAVPMTGQSIYDRGYTLYHQGRYVDAESSFQRFLQAHGDTELADNAQFWIGESRFARGDHMGALLAFQEVLDRFPAGNKVADALLKVGDCLLRLDNEAGGRQRYEEVLRRFPGSAAAAMAEERMNRPRS